MRPQVARVNIDPVRLRVRLRDGRRVGKQERTIRGNIIRDRGSVVPKRTNDPWDLVALGSWSGGQSFI